MTVTGQGDLAAAAEGAMQAGRLDEAARLWERVLAEAPDHPRALLHLGQHMLHRGDVARARDLLERAVAADPKNPLAALNLSFVFRATGDAAGEGMALARALAADPYYLPALLARGALEERTGRAREAARTYDVALTIAPDKPAAWLAEPLAHARAVVEANRAALDGFLTARLAAARARHAVPARFDEAKDVMTGRKKVYTQQPTLLHYPGLPAVQFYDRADFPWLDAVEAATDTIRDELLAVLKKDSGDFAPYVRHRPGVPLNQWAELNHSPRWSAYFLWRDGVRQDDPCAQCPATAALLETLPLAVVPGAAPAAFFSALAPKTRIPPHTGVTNTRLIVHLPLIVPEGCWYRVGNDRREWVPGKAWVFDDTIEHEAWNGSDLPRYVLIFDIWNPLLSEDERAMVCALLAGVRDYYAG